MQVFMLRKADDGWELIGGLDMAQIPHVGETIVTQTEKGVQLLPVTDVHHFVTQSSGSQGAFVHVGEADEREVPQEMARFFAR